MKYEDVEQVLRAPTWLAGVCALAREPGRDSDDGAVLRRLAKEVRNELNTNHAGRALRAAVAGLALGPRRMHVVAEALRPCTYAHGRLKKLRWLLGELHTIARGTTEIEHATPSVASWTSFATIVDDSLKMEEDVACRISRFPMQALHAVMSAVDEDFEASRRARIMTLAPSSYEELDTEQAASGAAQVIELLARTGKLSGDHDPSIRESHRLTRDEARELIFRGYWLREIREIEILVFRLGYLCIPEGSHAYRIEAPSDDVGFGLSDGWFQANHVPFVRHSRDLGETLRLKSLADAFADATNGESPYVINKDGKRPHFGYRVREGHASAAAAVVNRAVAFREEELDLRAAGAQLGVSVPRLLELEVTTGLLVRDILRFQRFVAFLALTRLSELKKSDLDEDEKRDARLLFMKTADFLNLAVAYGIDRPLAEAFFAAFAWNPSSPTHLDLQHHPFILLDDHVLVGLSLATESNLILNGLWTSGKRPYSDGTFDPLIEDLHRACEMAGLRSWPNVKYEWQGKTYEIDTLVIVGKSLLIIEAKNTLQPRSSFELRTTWDCIEKSSEQLDRHVRALADVEVRSRLARRLGVTLESLSLLTCSVVSHPLLSGIRVFGHPVRQCAVTCNFVASGTGTVWIGQKSRSTRLRTNGQLHEDDLVAFLADDNPVYRDAWASGFKRTRHFALGRAQLGVVEYVFSPIVQLARSGLCDRVHQDRLDAAIAKLDAIDPDAPRETLDATRAEVEAAYEAAFCYLEQLTTSDD